MQGTWAVEREELRGGRGQAAPILGGSQEASTAQDGAHSAGERPRFRSRSEGLEIETSGLSL